MFWYGGGWASWQVALMWVFMTAFWGLLIWGAWALITSASRRQGGQEAGDGKGGGGNALRLLDERLVRGEIDTAEYRRLRAVIAAGDGRRPAATGTARRGSGP